MSKYGRDRRRTERRAAKATRDDLENPVPWTPNPQEPTEELSETHYLPGGNARISQRVVSYRDGRVIEFAVTYWRRNLAGDWREVLCIDTCHHGTVHRHRDGDHSRHQDIVTITDQDVIQNALWEAIGEAYDSAYPEGNDEQG